MTFNKATEFKARPSPLVSSLLLPCTHTQTTADSEMGDSISLSWHKDQCSMAQGGLLSVLTVGSDASWHCCLRNMKTLSLAFTHERHRTPQRYLNVYAFNDLPLCVHLCVSVQTQGLCMSVYAWAHKCVWHCSSDSSVNASKVQCVSMCKCQSWYGRRAITTTGLWFTLLMASEKNLLEHTSN